MQTAFLSAAKGERALQGHASHSVCEDPLCIRVGARTWKEGQRGDSHLVPRLEEGTAADQNAARGAADMGPCPERVGRQWGVGGLGSGEVSRP